MPSFFDTISDIYDVTRALPKDTMAEITEVMEDEFGDCRRILEVGVGTGRFAHPLVKRGCRVVGADISRAMLRKAQDKGISHLVCGDACALPFRDASFGGLISVHVMHLIEDCNSVLSEMKRVGTGILISLLMKTSEFHAKEEYRKALSKQDYTLTFSGMGEHGLKDMVRPKRTLAIAPFFEVMSYRERLGLLEQRKHSYTIDTPQNAHAGAIQFLSDRFSAKLDSHPKSEVEVVVWDIDDIPGPL
ncbi:MAG: class I SAM-dependent methyltransferase [Thermoplasmata archaeon]|nr:MAG: class I SAM-dependent methyltransferase [Thermoplasmata archaeon]